jgi:pimeloyl-ACP methyl ester carboxylesterase
VADARAYPAPGKRYPVALNDRSGLTPSVHMLCKGPATPSLSTFVLEAGAGAPGVAYAGIVDALAAAGRRACFYDRLGFGWSDEQRAAPPAADQSAAVLRAALAAAGEAPPFIVAGHSLGGQLALLFAGQYSDLVSGVALLDSYDSVAIALAYAGAINVTARLPSGRAVVRPALGYSSAALLSVVDAVRAITPFGWARFITMSHDRAYPYTGALNAMYGGNKAWQVGTSVWPYWASDCVFAVQPWLLDSAR